MKSSKKIITLLLLSLLCFACGLVVLSHEPYKPICEGEQFTKDLHGNCWHKD